MRKFSKNQVEELRKLYFEDKLSSTQIAKQLGCSHNTITRSLIREGYVLRGVGQNIPRYTVNETYFDCINTSDKAYFLGLLYADGYMDEQNKGVKLSLQEQDGYIIEKFKEVTNFTGPIGILKAKKATHSNSTYIQIYNRKFYETTKNQGLYTKKSLTLTFPLFEIVPYNLLSHFIRGYFDGDGTAGTYRKQKRVGFVGTKEFLTELQYILIKELGLTQTKLSPKSDNNTYCYRIDRKDNIEKFKSFIYKEKGDFYLQRKYKKLYEL